MSTGSVVSASRAEAAFRPTSELTRPTNAGEATRVGVTRRRAIALANTSTAIAGEALRFWAALASFAETALASTSGSSAEAWTRTGEARRAEATRRATELARTDA